VPPNPTVKTGDIAVTGGNHSHLESRGKPAIIGVKAAARIQATLRISQAM
jgi:hypothetical protein